MATAAKSTSPGLSRPPAGDASHSGLERPKTGFSRQLYRKLISLYFVGSIVAVAVCFFLFFLGLEFTARQWMFFLFSIPWGMALYVVPDIYLIHRNYQRLGRALTKLDRGETPPPDEVTSAIVRALNLPMYAFTRITFIHGPGAALAGLIMTLGGNYLFDAQFQEWQIWTLATIVFFFASPTHGIFETSAPTNKRRFSARPVCGASCSTSPSSSRRCHSFSLPPRLVSRSPS
jgi:hypothetical protein